MNTTAESAESNYGTLDALGNERTNLTLSDARAQVEHDYNHGTLSSVVRYLDDGSIEDSFEDEDFSQYGRLVTSIQVILYKHSKSYNSSSDEAWDRNPICSEDGRAYPCEVRVDLEAALKS